MRAGEYADRIDNAGELLQTFLDSFHDETTTVQLQLLTATVKLFLKRPAESEELVQSVLSMATEHSDNPDLRDRGYIYWRLLSTDPDAAKAVVLADRPVIQARQGWGERGGREEEAETCLPPHRRTTRAASRPACSTCSSATSRRSPPSTTSRPR